MTPARRPLTEAVNSFRVTPFQNPRRSSMYAVIGIGGKQLRVSPGETVHVETIPVDPGTTVAFDQVLMIGGESGTQVGTPLVSGVRVHGTVVEHGRAKKV